MARCRAFIASTTLLSSALSPGGACTVPVPRPWRPLLHVVVALPLPIARAPPRRNGEGQRSSDHRRSSLATARIQRRWRNLALGLRQYPTSGPNLVPIRLRRPLRGHAASISKIQRDVQRIACAYYAPLFRPRQWSLLPSFPTVSPRRSQQIEGRRGPRGV